MAVRAEAWAAGRRSTEWVVGVRRVSARAPSSPPVARRMVDGERGCGVRALMLVWWMGVREGGGSCVGGRVLGVVVGAHVSAEEGRMVMLCFCSVVVSGQVAMWPSVLAVQSWMSAPKRR